MGSSKQRWASMLFQQRIASSIQGLRDTLLNRRENLLRLKNFKIEHNFPGYLLEGELDQENVNIDYSIDKVDKVFLLNQIEVELNTLNKIITMIQSMDMTDPKYEKILEVIQEHLNEGHKIILFSRYTATTSYYYKNLPDVFGKYGIARFDGIEESYCVNGKITHTNKEGVIDKFKTRDVSIIICSDRASEGLNLQSASVIINIDVPWNPSRVVQRFGRIDRFGQKQNNIYLYNVYYPIDIECKMYTRLEERQQNARSILGQISEVTSEDQKQELDIINSGSEWSKKVLDIKDNNDELFIGCEQYKIGFFYEFPKILIDIIEQGYLGNDKILIEKSNERKICLTIDGQTFSFSTYFGDEDFLACFSHKLEDIIIKLKTINGSFESKPSRKNTYLLNILGENSSLGFAIQNNDKKYFLPVNSYKYLLNYIITETPIPLDNVHELTSSDIKNFEKFLTEKETHYFRKKQIHIVPEIEPFDYCQIKVLGFEKIMPIRVG